MVDESFKAQVDAYVDEVWEDVVEDIRALVRHESVEDLSAAELGKPWGPASNAALVEAENIAERLGLEVTDVDGYLGFGDVPGASGPDTYVATIAHSDIVPVGLGWNYPALDVTRKDGFLIGRGVLDDKGPLAVSLWAAHFFKRWSDAGHELPYTLRAIIGNNEETGMGDVGPYLARYPEPAFCFSPDADFPLICGEKGVYQGEFISGPIAGGLIAELDGGTVPNAICGQATALVRHNAKTLPIDLDGRVTVEEAGEGLARVTATGIGGHASLPAGTLNALGLLADYLLKAGVCNDAQRTFLNLICLLTSDTDGTAASIACSDDKFGPLTCIQGTVRTDGDRFVLSVDSRYPTSTTGTDITAAMVRVGQSFGCAYRVLKDEVPFYISPTSPEIKALLDTYEEYTGREGKAFVIGGGTYARHFKHACAFGPHEPAEPEPDWVGMEHGPDEGVSEEHLRRALKIYIVSIARLMELELKTPAA